MLFTPRIYQEHIRDFALAHERSNVFASMGMGKTAATYLVYDILRLFGEARRALVLAPKRVARNTWPNERDKWRDSFGHLKVAAAIGTPAQRIAAVRSNPDILTINYDNIEWLIDGYGDNWPFDLVIADEATRLKGLRIATMTSTRGKEFTRGQGSKRAKALSHVAHKYVRRWINLTGSPAPNGLQDLWGLMWFVDGGRRLGRSFSAFEDRYFRNVPTPEGYSKLVPLPYAKQHIEDAIRDVCITVDAKDYFDIKAPIESIVYVDLPPKARKIYDDMESDLFAMIESNPVEVFNSGAKIQKCLQIGNGAVYVDDKRNWIEIHDEKIEALKSVAEEANGESIFVRYTHRPDLQRILKAFPRARFLDDNPKTEDEWNAGKIPMLVTHAASAGHGLSLQDGGRILCDFASEYNLEQDEQIIERIGPTRQVQSGYDRAVYRYRIVARDTIEENAVLPALRWKMSVQDSLKDAMKTRKRGC